MPTDRVQELDALLNAQGEDTEEGTDTDTDKDQDGQDQDTDTDADDENNDGAEDQDTDEDGEDETPDDEENGDDSQKQNGAGGEAPAQTKKAQDRWHGKSREEVIKEYEQLEQKHDQDTGRKQRAKDGTEKPAEGSAGLQMPSDDELSKMSPKKFVEWIIGQVEQKVSQTYESKTQIRDSVAQEVRTASKDHPLLKSSPDYRQLVLSLIDGAAQKGTVMPLKEACEKVDAFVGAVKGEDKKVTDAEKTRLKKAKAQVERGAGGAPSSSGEDKGAEDKRLESVFGTGGSTKSPLGGLGV